MKGEIKKEEEAERRGKKKQRLNLRQNSRYLNGTAFAVYLSLSRKMPE
jgi:hypothetical protein